MQIASTALSVRSVQPDRIRLCILGACVTMPRTASSVILHDVRSRTRRLLAGCRRISAVSSSFSSDGNAWSVSSGLFASRNVRNFLRPL